MSNVNEQPRDMRVTAVVPRWIPVFLIANFALVLILAFSLYSVRNGLGDEISKLQAMSAQTQSDTNKKLVNLSSDFDLMNKRVGVTSTELSQARETAQTLRRQHEQATRELAAQLAAKANSTDVDSFKQEASTKMAAIQEDSNAKLGSVSGEVTGIKNDLVATREEFGRQLVDVKTVLSEGIARNSGELAQLRQKGERDYFEFDIKKDSKHPMQRVADLQLGLTKADPKQHKYSIAIQVDDNRLEKKDRTSNEPVQFLVGRDQLRYEVVVNAVDKDRIRGYVSAPKDKVLSAEAPKLKQQ